MRRALCWMIPVALVGACNARRDVSESAQDTAAQAKPAVHQRGASVGYAPAAPPATAEAQVERLAQGAAAPPPAPAPAPAADLAHLKLIRTGNVTVEVDDFRAAAGRIAELARAHGGYVASSRSDAVDGDRRQGTLTVRVPADRFDVLLGGLKAIGKVLTDNVDVQDVTKAYFDLETRLRVKRATEVRLREILRTRTARLADVLEAERELARVTEEIENLEGTRRFYDEQVSFATIVVSLQEPRAVVRPGALDPVREAVRDSLRLMSQSAAALIYLVVFLAPWAIVAVPAWAAWRTTRRRRAARTAAPASA